MKNFKLTEESIEVNGKTLYRIECIKTFQYAKIGSKGGFVESEDNLSGNAWIGNDARVFEDARVYGNALVLGNAWVFGNAKVYGDAEIFGDSEIYGNAKVFGSAQVCKSARVFGSAKVFEDAHIYGNARVYGSAGIVGSAKVFGGDWSETPFQIQGSRHFVNMCSPTELAIGCQKHTLSFWKENFEEIGNEFKYTKEQIEEYEKYINLAIEMYGI